MIKLSDYLNYLNNEVIQARKKADEQAILMAKEYANHEYLKYFKVPRFSMPNVKLSIPIKINELDSTTTYNFDRDYDAFVSDVNERIQLKNSEKQLSIKPISKEELLKNEKLIAIFDKLEAEDYKQVRSLKENMKKIDVNDIGYEVITSKKYSRLDGARLDNNEQNELKKIFESSLANRYRPVQSNLKNIFIDPDTSPNEDKGKVLLNLEVEMIEEGIRIRKVKDKNGNEVEEIIID